MKKKVKFCQTREFLHEKRIEGIQSMSNFYFKIFFRTIYQIITELQLKCIRNYKRFSVLHKFKFTNYFFQPRLVWKSTEKSNEKLLNQKRCKTLNHNERSLAKNRLWTRLVHFSGWNPTLHKRVGILFTIPTLLCKEGFKPEITSHSAYVATSTKSDGAKIDGFLYPNFM